MAHRVTPLPASGFLRSPWKNGRGVTLTIAGERMPGATGDGWDQALWRLGTTDIVEDGPFSDLAGFDRWQTVVSGQGLLLETPEGPIDLSEPFAVRNYPGEAPIRSILTKGPVGVVNLIARRGLVAAAMRVLKPGEAVTPGVGLHVLFAPKCDAIVRIAGADHPLSGGDALRVEGDAGAATVVAGIALLATVRPG